MYCPSPEEQLPSTIGCDRGGGWRLVAWSAARRLPERFLLTVHYQTPDLKALCKSWPVLARVDNRWHLDNQEHGQAFAARTLEHSLASDLGILK
jgi:hypothetical protein